MSLYRTDVHTYLYMCLFKLWIPSFITKNPPIHSGPFQCHPSTSAPSIKGSSSAIFSAWPGKTSQKSKRRDHRPIVIGKMMRKPMIAGSYPTFSMLPHAISLLFCGILHVQRTSAMRMYFTRSANNVGKTPMGWPTTGKHSALLNQRYRVVRWHIQYMVLLQEFLHPPRASRDDCGERITQKSIPSRVAKSVSLVLDFCAVFQRSL